MSASPELRRPVEFMPDARDIQLLIEAAERAAAAGDLAGAEGSLREAARLQEATLGPSHADLARTFNNLAIACELANKLQDAEQFYRRAYAVAASALEPDHPLVVTSRDNLREFCAARGLAFADHSPAPVAEPPSSAVPHAAPSSAVAPARSADAAQPAAHATSPAAVPPFTTSAGRPAADASPPPVAPPGPAATAGATPPRAEGSSAGGRKGSRPVPAAAKAPGSVPRPVVRAGLAVAALIVVLVGARSCVWPSGSSVDESASGAAEQAQARSELQASDPAAARAPNGAPAASAPRSAAVSGAAASASATATTDAASTVSAPASASAPASGSVARASAPAPRGTASAGSSAVDTASGPAPASRSAGSPRPAAAAAPASPAASVIPTSPASAETAPEPARRVPTPVTPATLGRSGAAASRRAPPQRVAHAELCSRLSTAGAWRCDPVPAPAGPGAFFFYTRVTSPTDTSVEHRWYLDGRLRQAVELGVRANWGPGYRTYSRQTITREAAGEWRVEVRSEGGDVLAEERFVVR